MRNLINEMVSDLIKNNIKNLEKNQIKNIKDVYKSENCLVNFSKSMQNFDKEIKSFLKYKMYFNPKVKKPIKEKKLLNFYLKRSQQNHINLSKKTKIIRTYQEIFVIL